MRCAYEVNQAVKSCEIIIGKIRITDLIINYSWSLYEMVSVIYNVLLFILIPGSSHILTPAGLLNDIKALSKGPMEKFTIEERSNA